ncbi:hypothetical protein ACFRI7_32835 [Streptomyces sp. NPDC056716]|uniref:hypothetical protein n=1 Tax=unclassified Streptomyces TaxID=2593676 RepID=UPI0036CC119D
METLLTAHPALWAATLLAGAVAGVTRAWIAHRTAVRREEEHTRRVELALDDTSGPHRVAVVRAARGLGPSPETERE